MPYINKPKSKRKQDNQYKKRQKIYQSKIWEKMRMAKLMEHPLCYACQCEGTVELAIDLHHLRTFTDGNDANEINVLAYDSNNIVPLCKYHHWSIHHGYLRGAKSLEEIRQYIEAKKGNEK